MSHSLATSGIRDALRHLRAGRPDCPRLHRPARVPVSTSSIQLSSHGLQDPRRTVPGGHFAQAQDARLRRGGHRRAFQRLLPGQQLTVLYEAINLPPTQRRNQFLVLIGTSVMTNDEMMAFIFSVDLCFNVQRPGEPQTGAAARRGAAEGFLSRVHRAGQGSRGRAEPHLVKRLPSCAEVATRRRISTSDRHPETLSS